MSAPIGSMKNKRKKMRRFNWLAALPKRKAEFIEPMECAPVTKLPNGPEWIYEIKLDGYRAIAVKADGRVNLFSRRRKSFDHHYPLIVEALAELPEGTVVDGEVVVSMNQADRISICSKIFAGGRWDNFYTTRGKPSGHLTRLPLRKKRRDFVRSHHSGASN